MEENDITQLTGDGSKRVFVDFDKTITTGEGPPFWSEDSYEEPDEEMVEWVNEQYNKGNFIVVWTARPWSQAQNVAGYLTTWGVKYYGIRCNKGGADIYVDDKCINVKEVDK
jgi:hypothetical protein